MEMKTVGMQSVLPLGLSRMYAGLVASQPVYPLASKVLRRPPFGKLEASGSPWVRVFPANSAIDDPSSPGSRKLSCFSAVRCVNG